MNPKIILIVLISLFAHNVFSQPKSDLIIKQDFVPMLDSLIGPPVDCDGAWNLVAFDSSEKKYDIVFSIEEQDRRIQKLISDISTYLDLKKTNKIRVAPPSAKGPPGTMPPANTEQPTYGNISEKFIDVWEDFEDANLALTKLTEIKEQFKDEIKDMQLKVNEELHKTRETDYNAHVLIINDFMKFTAKQYQKHKLAFRENMNKIDAVIKKYDYGNTIKSSRIKKEILKIQLSQSEHLKFLSNITKEFTIIGSDFYEEKFANLQN